VRDDAESDARARLAAQEQLKHVKQGRRLQAPEEHAFWGVLLEELEQGFRRGLGEGSRAARSSHWSAVAVIAQACGYGDNQALVVRQARAELAPEGHAFWRVLADELKSAWYVGYYAGLRR